MQKVYERMQTELSGEGDNVQAVCTETGAE
jgi:hypothetical protein